MPLNDQDLLTSLMDKRKDLLDSLPSDQIDAYYNFMGNLDQEVDAKYKPGDTIALINTFLKFVRKVSTCSHSEMFLIHLKQNNTFQVQLCTLLS